MIQMKMKTFAKGHIFQASLIFVYPVF